MIYLTKKNENKYQCVECGFNLTPNQKIMTQLYAWLSVDTVNGYEGVMGIMMPNGVLMAAVSSNIESVKEMKPEIVRACKGLNMTSKLVKFSRSEIIDEC